MRIKVSRGSIGRRKDREHFQEANVSSGDNNRVVKAEGKEGVKVDAEKFGRVFGLDDFSIVG